MQANAGNVCNITTAGPKIRFIAIESPFHVDRFAITGIVIFATAGKNASAILRLPKVQDGSTVGVLEVVCGSESLSPVCALAISDPHDPGTGSLVAPIAETNTGPNSCEDRLLGDR